MVYNNFTPIYPRRSQEEGEACDAVSCPCANLNDTRGDCLSLLMKILKKRGFPGDSYTFSRNPKCRIFMYTGAL